MSYVSQGSDTDNIIIQKSNLHSGILSHVKDLEGEMGDGEGGNGRLCFGP